VLLLEQKSTGPDRCPSGSLLNRSQNMSMVGRVTMSPVRIVM
jgi:hypothetical protein